MILILLYCFSRNSPYPQYGPLEQCISTLLFDALVLHMCGQHGVPGPTRMAEVGRGLRYRTRALDIRLCQAHHDVICSQL